METDNFLFLNWTTPQIDQPICFFSQSHFTSAIVETNILTGNEFANVAFHNSILIGKSSFQCSHSQTCLHKPTNPFFIRYTSVSKTPIMIKFHITNPSFSIVGCAIEPGNEFLGFSNAVFKCTTSSPDTFLYLSISIFLIGAFLLILFINKCVTPLISRNPTYHRLQNSKKEPFANSLNY
jgi:hypothetical protein